MTSVSVNVTIINDTVLEDNETFHLIIVIQNTTPNITIHDGEINETIVTIVNDGGSGMYIYCNYYYLVLA